MFIDKSKPASDGKQSSYVVCSVGMSGDVPNPAAPMPVPLGKLRGMITEPSRFT